MRICADVGGSFIDVALVDGDTAIHARTRMPTPTNDWNTFVEVFREVLIVNANLVADGSPLSLAVAGLVDPADGCVTSANIECIHGRPLARDLHAALGHPVIVTNDADAFALAEATLGVGRGHRLVFGIILGTGVGGGFIEDGRIVTGSGGIGGEWGHGQVLVQSPMSPGALPVFACGCGRSGCLDTIGGARGLERLHMFLHGHDLTSHVIADRWLNGDVSASQTIDYYSDLLAGPLAMLLNSVPASIIPIGGGLSEVTSLISLLDGKVRVGLLRQQDTPILIPTELRGDAGILGAAIAARQL